MDVLVTSLHLNKVKTNFVLEMTNNTDFSCRN